MQYIMFMILLSFFSIAMADETKNSVKIPAMEKVPQSMTFSDDLDFENMLKAIKRQEVYFERRDLSVNFKFGNRVLTRGHLHASLLEFKKYVEETIDCFKTKERFACYVEFNIKMNTAFEVYKPVPLDWERGYQTKQTMFTAYYSPDMHGSKTQSETYKYPIYGMPSDEKLRASTSDQINYEGVLKGQGLELFYVKESLYDIWLLHVEGGGRVQVENTDGTTDSFYLSYAGTNKKKFNMLYKYMVANGMLKKEEAGSIKRQRNYFESHPEHQREILKSCESYVYFKVTETEPLGVHNIPLTPNRSMATDYRRLTEYGLISYVEATNPKATERMQRPTFSRFFINQDTGGAIKGNARCDLYFGYGKEAELAANKIYGLGNQYYLILK